MSEVRVLLVDDHPVVREGLRALIDRQSDMRVVGEAADGKSACEKAAQLFPDVVVMDVSMPGMDGVQATQEIGRRSPRSRVVALTVHEDRSYVRALIAAGAAAYVLKRSAPDDLVRAIQIVAKGEVYIDPGVAAVMLRKLVGSHSEHDPVELSDREAEVLRLIAHGLSNKEIAARLDISGKTVETYKARAMEKLGLTGRADIVRLAVREGWLNAVLTNDESGKS